MPPTLLEFGCYADDNVIRHVYHAPLTVELNQLVLAEGHGFIDAGSDSTGQLILKSGRSGATFSTSSSTNFVGFHEQGLIKKA